MCGCTTIGLLVSVCFGLTAYCVAGRSSIALVFGSRSSFVVGCTSVLFSGCSIEPMNSILAMLAATSVTPMWNAVKKSIPKISDLVGRLNTMVVIVWLSSLNLYVMSIWPIGLCIVESAIRSVPLYGSNSSPQSLMFLIQLCPIAVTCAPVSTRAFTRRSNMVTVTCGLVSDRFVWNIAAIQPSSSVCTDCSFCATSLISIESVAHSTDSYSSFLDWLFGRRTLVNHMWWLFDPLCRSRNKRIGFVPLCKF